MAFPRMSDLIPPPGVFESGLVTAPLSSIECSDFLESRESMTGVFVLVSALFCHKQQQQLNEVILNFFLSLSIFPSR